MSPEFEQSTLVTHSARVFSALRADILAGKLLPGSPLKTENLRSRYGAGVSPIREALMRLEAEGLVRLEQNKGFKVSEISPEHLGDLSRSRVEIEGLALRWSIANGHIEWEADLLAAFHRLSRHAKIDTDDPSQVSEDWRRAHWAFHRTLVAACGSPTILSIRDGLFDQAERYVALAILAAGGLRDDVGEHEAIMQAALARDPDQAVKLNAEHIERTAMKLDRSFSDGRLAAMQIPRRSRRSGAN